MAECELLPACPFFNGLMKGMPSTSQMIKSQYCSGSRADNRWCARHMVSERLGAERVPANLYPSDLAHARKLLRE